MAANPTSGWDQVPLYGTWRKPFTEAPQTGFLELTIDRRVTRTDGQIIYTPGKVTIPLGTETGSVATTVPASDDPDLSPESKGFQVHIREVFNDGTGKAYDVQPLLAHLDLTPPGVNLGLVYVDPGSPSVPAPVLVKGVAGGVATLDSTGKVPLAQLPSGIGGSVLSVAGLTGAVTAAQLAAILGPLIGVPTGPSNAMTTESGNDLMTESGDYLVLA